MRDSKRDTDVQNSLLDSVREGEGGMIQGNGMETCIISYKKRIASPGLMQEGSVWGTHVYLWWIPFDIWQNQYNIVKLKNKIKLKKKEKHMNIFSKYMTRNKKFCIDVTSSTHKNSCYCNNFIIHLI